MSQPDDQDKSSSIKQDSPQEVEYAESPKIKCESPGFFITGSSTKNEAIVISDSEPGVEMADVTELPDMVVDTVEAAPALREQGKEHGEDRGEELSSTFPDVTAEATVDMINTGKLSAEPSAETPLGRNLVPSPSDRRLQNLQDEEALAEIRRAAAAAFRAELRENAASASAPFTESATKPIDFDDQPVLEQQDFDKEADAAADADAAAVFKEFQQSYERKAKKNQTTLQDEINFKRAAAAEDRRLRVLQKKRAYKSPEDGEGQVQDDDEPMFFSDNDPSSGMPVPIVPRTARDKDTSASRPAKRVKAGEKKQGSTALQQSMQIGLEAGLANARKKEKRKPRNPSAKKKAPQSRVSKPKGKKGKATPRKKHGRRADLANIDTLLNNDIIADALANKGKEAQPVFTSRNRKNALTELIASMPENQRNLYVGDKNDLDKDCKQFSWKGPGSMHSDGKGGWLLKGMNTSLFHYQLQGSAWMRERENSSTPPFGGLCADSMGFGKTIQMLANMVDGRPKDKARNRTTLIIVPAALTSQWLDQIKMHVQRGLLGEVMLYRSGARVISEDAAKTLSNCGVVITTYHEILHQYPKFRPPDYLSSETAKAKWWEKHFEETKGPFFRIVFHRLILDEAHYIKNHEGSTSQAVRALRGKYRWAITGTPIQNTVEEFYPYFHFLQVSNTGDFDCFRSNYATKSERTMNRLHAMLKLIMLRRTGKNLLFGRPIVSLPALDHDTERIEWQNDTEKAIYNIVRTRFIAKLNEWSLGGMIEKQYRHVFVMFLRLRQICAHILLVQATIKDLLEAEDIEKLWRMTEREVRPAEDDPQPSTMSVLRSMLEKQNSKDQTQADGTDQGRWATAGECAADDCLEETGGAFGHSFKFRKYLRKLHDSGSWEEINARSMCHKCHQVPEDPHITIPCEHLYCKECLTLILYEAGVKEKDRALCIECGQEFERTEPCRGFDQAAFNIDNPSAVPRGRRSRGPTDPEGNELDWLSLPGPPLSSAKTVAVKAFLLRWLAEDRGVKCIVFTQFLGMIKILARICAHEEWEYCTFTGAMRPDAREKALAEFRDNSEKRILLATLKSGGLGLNLTSASKVIVMDPWWNQSVEDQAYSRVFRIGQKRDVEVRRLVIKDSIDTQLLLKMQERKNQEISRAIGDEEQPSSYSVHELLTLFGPVQVDEATGVPIITDPSELEEEFIFVQDEEIQDDSDAEMPQSAVGPRIGAKKKTYGQR